MKNLDSIMSEIATNLQVGDVVRAHAQMEVVALFLEVQASAVYAVAAYVADESSKCGVSARTFNNDRNFSGWDEEWLLSEIRRYESYRV